MNNYDYSLKNIKNWRKEFNREVFDKTLEYQKKYNFDIGKGEHATWNNEADAFKHALMQALLVYKAGGMELPARVLGNFHEFEGDISGQPQNEKLMDLFNNKVGRELAVEVLKELKKEHLGELKNQKEFENLFAEKLFQKMKSGELITNPDDVRKFTESNHIYTREEINKMSTDEFAKHENAIMKQLREKGIPTNSQLQKHNQKSSAGNSANSNNGRWITINGNHVLIKD